MKIACLPETDIQRLEAYKQELKSLDMSGGCIKGP
jgi:hypothetical protein